MTKVLGLGHSHIVAIAKGCYALQHEKFRFAGAALVSRFVYLYEPTLEPTLVGEDEARLNPELCQIIEKEQPDFFVLSISGNEHIALSIEQKPERFDFILGDEPDLALEPGATLLPEAAVRETFREKMAPTLKTLAAIRAATDKPITVIEAPAPLPNSRIIEYPREFFRRAFDPGRLSGELLRYKMWRMQGALFRESCEKHDLIYIPAPDDFIEPPGLLARRLWGSDASHANEVFGREMMIRAATLVEPLMAACA